MKNNNLFEDLDALGFPMLVPDKNVDANMVLAEIIKSKDSRLWEGFPVVFANSANKKLLDYKKINSLLKNRSDKVALQLLIAMSLALYKVLKLKFHRDKSLYDLLPADKVNVFLKKLKGESTFVISEKTMSPERLKTIFNNYYFTESNKQLNDFISMRDDLSLEYSLSRIFSQKQKELFLKKLRREKLSKTEKEYFSRVVKKKVLALANPELHRLAQKLLD